MVRGYGREVGYAECYGWLQWWGWSGWWRSGGISNPDCNTLLRQNPARLPRRTVSDDCSYIEPRSLYGCYCEDIVCLTIRYHETDGSDAVTDSKTSLKTLHQDTDKSLHLLREIGYRSIMAVDRGLSSP